MNLEEIQTLMEKLDLGAPVEVIQKSWGHLFSLPIPHGADFGLYACLYSDGEPQLGAERLDEAKESDFWHGHFEIWDFDDEEARAGAFEGILGTIVSNPTRIVQRKGRFWWSWTAVSETPEGAVEIHGASRLGRFWWRPPKSERRRTFWSPAVVGLRSGRYE